MTRGTKNNNPGNLRHGSDWHGLSKTQTDNEFCQFICPTYGIRALAKTLLTYQQKHHLFTVPEMIARYAPATENDLNSYISHVCHETGFLDHQAVNLRVPANMVKLVKAIIKHENGSQPYTYEIEDGIKLAYE